MYVDIHVQYFCSFIDQKELMMKENFMDELLILLLLLCLTCWSMTWDLILCGHTHKRHIIPTGLRPKVSSVFSLKIDRLIGRKSWKSGRHLHRVDSKKKGCNMCPSHDVHCINPQDVTHYCKLKKKIPSRAPTLLSSCHGDMSLFGISVKVNIQLRAWRLNYLRRRVCISSTATGARP